MADNGLNICVLFRCSKKTGKIDTTMTGMGSALMKMWALQNTPKTKDTYVFDRDSGECVFAVHGAEFLPKIIKPEELKKMHCEDMGISLADLQEITDDRFDKEVV